jgi:hypothetical protein
VKPDRDRFLRRSTRSFTMARVESMKERTSLLPAAASGRKWRIRAPHIRLKPRRGARNATSITVVKLSSTTSSSPVAFYAGVFVRIDIAYNVFEREVLSRADATHVSVLTRSVARDPGQDAYRCVGRRFRTRARPRARGLCQVRLLLRPRWQQLGATGTGLPECVTYCRLATSTMRNSRNTEEEIGADRLFSVLSCRTPLDNLHQRH